MTYCVGLLLEQGFVMMSDSRTNGGVDNLSTYSKLAVVEKPGERVIALMGSGNLAVSQTVVNRLTSGEGAPEGTQPQTLSTVSSNARSRAARRRLRARSVLREMGRRCWRRTISST